MKIAKACALLLIAAKSQGQEAPIRPRPVVVDFAEHQQINEPSISINPKSPNEIAIATNLDRIYFSKNYGKSWKLNKIQSSLGIYGDPVIRHNTKGNLFFVHLSKTPNKKWGDFFDRIVIQKSVQNSIFNNGVGVGFNQHKMQDKPWMKIKGNKNIFLSWTEFDKYKSPRHEDKSRIRFSYSNNEGENFSEAITISDTTGDCLDGNHTLEGATTAYAKNGTIFCAWAGHHKIYFDSSSDGGLTWNNDKIIAKQESGWNLNLRHFPRCNGLPFLFIDPSNGPYAQRMYLLYADNLYGDLDIFLKYSDNLGKTWSGAIRVNQDNLSNGKDQFLPNMSIDPSTGFLYIIYYDRRNSSTNTFVATYLNYSEDGGSTFKEIQIGSSFAPPGENYFFGDYLDIDAYRGIIHPVWTEHHKDQDRILTLNINHKQLEQPVTPTHDSIVYFLSKKELLFFHPSKTFSLEIKIRNKKEIFFKKEYQQSGQKEYLVSLGEFSHPKLKIKIRNEKSTNAFKLQL